MNLSVCNILIFLWYFLRIYLLFHVPYDNYAVMSYFTVPLLLQASCNIVAIDRDETNRSGQPAVNRRIKYERFV